MSAEGSMTIRYSSICCWLLRTSKYSSICCCTMPSSYVAVVREGCCWLIPKSGNVLVASRGSFQSLETVENPRHAERSKQKSSHFIVMKCEAICSIFSWSATSALRFLHESICMSVIDDSCMLMMCNVRE